MKNLKKLLVVVTTLGVLGTAGSVYAATLKTPAEITAGVTGQTVETVTEQRSTTGKTYGTIAEEAGKLDEFQTQMLEQRKAVLDEQVAAGDITQAQADEIYNNIKNNQATCYGQGMGGRGYGMGGGYGMGRGAGNGAGFGRGGACGLGATQSTTNATPSTTQGALN
ncbi:DUF2680 domain-containing protein [Desulfitobacterium metallireducens]|uniref:DUF2680 domain-containing protein n=1 Tax=Desulfitobacterium metallireducens DSM 15288 TaxID=871968 RepID=W0E739_9FIRM|nr:DUF2680 domain-containing protein [Desulfitobacterium metallireducens]AHF06592.1 hypothetical protein DESME_05630 [Desulfitobacterium metallireducens DSM 15288]